MYIFFKYFHKFLSSPLNYTPYNPTALAPHTFFPPSHNITINNVNCRILNIHIPYITDDQKIFISSLFNNLYPLKKFKLYSHNKMLKWFKENNFEKKNMLNFWLSVEYNVHLNTICITDIFAFFISLSFTTYHYDFKMWIFSQLFLKTRWHCWVYMIYVMK